MKDDFFLPKLKAPLGSEEFFSAGKRLFFLHLQSFYQWGSLSFSLRQDRFNFDRLKRELLLFKELIIQLGRTPPLGITLDLFELFRHGEHFTTRPLPPDEHNSSLLIRLQNDLYFPILRHPSFPALRRLLLSFPDEAAMPFHLSMREEALIFLIESFWRPASHLLVEPFPPPLLPKQQRKAFPLFVENARKLFGKKINKIHWMEEQLTRILRFYLHRSRSSLLDEEWHFTLLHFDFFKAPFQRLRWTNLNSLFQQFDEDLSFPQHHVTELSSQFVRFLGSVGPYHDGSDGISRRGPLDNILSSEWLYWEENTNALDLFSWRFLQKELLYYERETLFSSMEERSLFIFLDLDRTQLLHKNPEDPTNAISLLFAFLAHLSSKIEALTPDEPFQIHFRLAPREKWKNDISLYEFFLQTKAPHTILHLLPHHEAIQQQIKELPSQAYKILFCSSAFLPHQFSITSQLDLLVILDLPSPIESPFHSPEQLLPPTHHLILQSPHFQHTQWKNLQKSIIEIIWKK